MYMENLPETEAAAQAPPKLAKVVVLMVPLPAQGHLNQLINLSRLISSAGTDGVHVHFACSATHNRQAKLRVHGWDPSTFSKIHFHDLPFPEISTPPPDPSAALKFPAHLRPTLDAAVTHLRRPLVGLLRSLSATSHRVAVVHDSLMSFIAEDTVEVPSAEADAFRSSSVFATFGFNFLDSTTPVEKVMEYIPQKLKQIYLSYPSPPLKTCFTDAFLEFLRNQMNHLKFDVGELHNTCDPIEGDFLQYYSSPQNLFHPAEMRTWAIGPLNPVAVDVMNISQHSAYSRRRHECMEWLEKLPPKSVLYVSFGTTSSMSDEQIKELAKGLRDSNQRFLWVVREADGGDMFSRKE